MRWYVEVSRVGESSVADEYCVEAKQWQGALQEARKLRGDAGALSKFSIELLDRGYRAVDPALKLRYLINEAPPEAKLSEDAGKPTRADQPAAKARQAEALSGSAFSNSVVPAAPVGGASAVPRPASHVPQRNASLAPPRNASSAPSREGSRAPAPSSPLLVPDDPVPPAPRLPSSSSGSADSLRPTLPAFELVRQRAEEPRPESPITYREFAYAVRPGATRTQIEALLQDRFRETRASIEDRPPGKFVQLAVFDHVFKRKPERPPLATFAWKDWRGEPILAFPGFGGAPMGPLSQVPPASESLIPPASTAPAASHKSPPVSSVPSPAVAPSSARVIPMAPVVIESARPPSAAAPASPAAPPPVAAPPLAAPPAAPAPSAPLPAAVAAAPSAPPPPVAIAVAPSAPPAAAVAPEVAASAAPPKVQADAVAVAPLVADSPAAIPSEAPTSAGSVAAAPLAAAAASDAAASDAAAAPALGLNGGVPVPEARAASEPPAGTANGVSHASAGHSPAVPLVPAEFEINFESSPARAAPSAPLAAKSAPNGERASRPRIPSVRRRAAGEDLIGELFEIMHDLHFMRDVAAGAEFVLAVLDEVLPCEGALIHVFDINTSHFVVVRAKGPHAPTVLLGRMPDQDPLVLSVMRGPRALSVTDARNDARFRGARWQALGVEPKRALCGAVKQGGRYLGLIELANPQGDTPFHGNELNALDYICEQFAEFLSKKPIVLTADVVLARS